MKTEKRRCRYTDTIQPPPPPPPPPPPGQGVRIGVGVQCRPSHLCTFLATPFLQFKFKIEYQASKLFDEDSCRGGIALEHGSPDLPNASPFAHVCDRPGLGN